MGLLAGYASPIRWNSSFYHLVNWQIPSNWMLFCVGIVSGNEIDTHEHAHTQDGPEKHSLENTFSHTERAKVDEILMMCGCFCTNRKKNAKQKSTSTQTASWPNSHISSFVSCYGLHRKWFPSVNVYQQMLATSFSRRQIIIHLFPSQIVRCVWPMSGVFFLFAFSCGQNGMN